MTAKEAIETLRANYPDACYEQLREAAETAIEALKARDTARDTISRQAVIDALAEQIALCDKALNTFGISMKDEYAVKVERASLVAFRETLEYLPPAQPERKVGKWIKVNGKTAINCSACYHCSWSLSFKDTVKRFNFCPNCGADMRGEQND